MKKCGEALERFDLRANPLVLNFEGLKHFRNEIIFVALRDGDESIRLKEIAGMYIAAPHVKNSLHTAHSVG